MSELTLYRLIEMGGIHSISSVDAPIMAEQVVEDIKAKREFVLDFMGVKGCFYGFFNAFLREIVATVPIGQFTELVTYENITPIAYGVVVRCIQQKREEEYLESVNTFWTNFDEDYIFEHEDI